MKSMTRLGLAAGALVLVLAASLGPSVAGQSTVLAAKWLCTALFMFTSLTWVASLWWTVFKMAQFGDGVADVPAAAQAHEPGG